MKRYGLGQGTLLHLLILFISFEKKKEIGQLKKLYNQEAEEVINNK